MTSLAKASACLLGLFLQAGCSPQGGEAGGVASQRSAVKTVRHTYFPRLESENYWETVRLKEAGPEFLLFIHPRILTPAEGPWSAVFKDPDGRPGALFQGLKVDVATGNFTFLCSSQHFSAGDWTIELELEEGGLVSGARTRTYRFRIVE